MRKNKKGDAMIMVICIMAIFLALSLAAIFSASSLMSGALKSKTRDQCRLSAVTFSKMLKEEFEWKTDYEDTEKNKLRNYIREEMEGGWTYYNEGEAGHTNLEQLKKEFTVNAAAIGDMNENAGEMTVSVYWTSDQTSFSPHTYKDFQSAKVVIEVTCKREKQEQTIRTFYTITYQPYNADGTVESPEGWGPEEFKKWVEQTPGNYLAWTWSESEVR